jgi:glutamate/tyrosine decarboxylase-like PLP-dependent enzyme
MFADSQEWNPSDYGVHLSRRARGLPFWFSLAAHGTNAYRDAVETILTLTRDVAQEIRRRPSVELILDPELSVVVFRRVGWTDADYVAWSDRMLRDQVAFCLPSTWKDERVMRFCFVNPRTTLDEVAALLDTMEDRSPR